MAFSNTMVDDLAGLLDNFLIRDEIIICVAAHSRRSLSMVEQIIRDVYMALTHDGSRGTRASLLRILWLCIDSR